MRAKKLIEADTVRPANLLWWVILNKEGHIRFPRLFETEEEAGQYLREGEFPFRVRLMRAHARTQSSRPWTKSPYL